MHGPQWPVAHRMECMDPSGQWRTGWNAWTPVASGARDGMHGPQWPVAHRMECMDPSGQWRTGWNAWTPVASGARDGMHGPQWLVPVTTLSDVVQSVYRWLSVTQKADVHEYQASIQQARPCRPRCLPFVVAPSRRTGLEATGTRGRIGAACGPSPRARRCHPHPGGPRASARAAAPWEQGASIRL
jgi:pterin-4a-carbinolamine dehydratase